jgi:lipoprotein-anchoring transpeptidase ErfK/SrfK
LVNFLKNFIDKKIVSKRVKLISLIPFFIFTGFICISCGANSIGIIANYPSTGNVDSINFEAAVYKDTVSNRDIDKGSGNNFNEASSINSSMDLQDNISNGYNPENSNSPALETTTDTIPEEVTGETSEENTGCSATGEEEQASSGGITGEANDNNQNNNEGQNNDTTGQDNNDAGQNGEEIKDENNEAIQSETDNVDFSNSADFRIEVDLSCQKVLIYYKDKLLKEWICSGGTQEKPTPKGEFKTFQKGEYFWNPRYNMGGYYWVKFYEDYLFHSVPFDENNNIIQEEYNKLGTPASHGCIRLEVENARWLYEMLPLGVKVIIY